MDIYILDSSSLLAFDDLCQPGGQRNHFYSSLTSLAISGLVICPVGVIAECSDFAQDSPGTTWVRAAQGHFRDASEQWDHMGVAMDLCPRLSDEESFEEQANVAVVALGLYRKEQGQHVIVVTDDWADGPATECLGTSAPKANLDTMTAAEFVRAVLALP